MSLSYKFLLIVQSNHSQAVRWSCRTGRTAVTRSKDCFHILRFPFPASDFDQSPRNDADHIIEKSTSGHPDSDNICALIYRTGIDRAHRVLRLGIHRAEAFKIISSDHLPCRFPHKRHIKLITHKKRELDSENNDSEEEDK